ncbi:MAG TPA: hypothetical protein VFN02_16215, partial [Ktedonobacteraceae bacterium]|nr:hypothetical protein [Ktedonobacteraceae bacterium]
IKGIVTGALFRWFMKWLRGRKDTTKAAQSTLCSSLVLPARLFVARGHSYVRKCARGAERQNWRAVLMP